MEDIVQTGELATIREHLGRFRAVTLQSLDRTPPDKLTWSPAPGLMSFAGQYAHLADVERIYVHGLSGVGWNAVMDAPADPATIEGLRADLVRVRAATETWMDALLPATLEDVVLVPWLPVRWPLRSWLWYLVEHELHHKAQLAQYLHMQGIEAPFFAFVLPPGVRPDKRPVAAQPAEGSPT